MEISVIVPTYNRREMVRRCLETLFSQSCPSLSYEIIVVVDGSRDDTAESLRSLNPACGFRIIEQENRGLAGARNTGYRASKSELVLFLDDDMLCDRGLVEAHLAVHRAGENVAGFGALFLSADSPRSLSAECFHREIGAFHLERKRAPGTPWHERECVFSNSSLPRRLLVKLGGFDERFRMREDLEFGTRLFATGATPQYIDGAIAYQYYDKSAADLVREARAFAIADVMYAQKYGKEKNIGELSWYERQPRWKRRLRGMAAAAPIVTDCLLTPLCGLGTLFYRVPAMRYLGVRALQMRRRIHWLHTVVKLQREQQSEEIAAQDSRE